MEEENKLPAAFGELGMHEDGWFIFRITGKGSRVQCTKWTSDDVFSNVDKDMIFQFMERTVADAIEKDEQILTASEDGESAID